MGKPSSSSIKLSLRAGYITLRVTIAQVVILNSSLMSAICKIKMSWTRLCGGRVGCGMTTHFNLKANITIIEKQKMPNVSSHLLNHWKFLRNSQFLKIWLKLPKNCTYYSSLWIIQFYKWHLPCLRRPTNLTLISRKNYFPLHHHSEHEKK